MPRSQYTFRSGTRVCLNLLLIAGVCLAVAAYLALGWMCLYLVASADTVTYDEHFGSSLKTIVLSLAYCALIPWLSQLRAAVRASCAALQKGHHAIYRRSQSAAA